MILTLVIILIVLIVALWISAMLVWWRSEQTKPIKTIKRRDVIHSWNKAARLMRRSVYGSMRYSKQATLWGNTKARNAFVTIFPTSKPAFIEKDMLTGLEHGPSSYFLANLSPASGKPTARRRKTLLNQGKAVAMKIPARRKKIVENDITTAVHEEISEASNELSE
ncbi:MAG: hypothetical protein ABIO57_02260 [Candidatus Paceibacterota bacterium]